MPLNYYNNNSDIDITEGELRAQYYTPNKLKLLDPVNGYLQNPWFGFSDFDRVELHVYDINKNLLQSNHKVDGWAIDTDKDGAPLINVSINENLRAAGFSQGVFTVVYNFHRDAAGAPVGPKFKVETISKSRTEIRLVATDLFAEDSGDELLESFFSRFQKLKTTSTVQAPYQVQAIPNNPLWTNMSINFGFNRLYHVTAWVIDDVFPLIQDQPETIILKLLKPLPLDITEEQMGWLVADATQPAINRVQLESEVVFVGNSLRGPNFDLCLDETPRVQTDFKSYNDVLGGDSDTKSNILNNVSSSLDGMRLNIDYSVLENYVHFSSAETRVSNFIYKLKQIRSYDTNARTYDYSEYPASDLYIYEYTGSHGSKYVKQYQKTWVDKKVKLINEFDDFEKWLYFESGSVSKYNTTSGSRGGGIHDWSRSAIQPFPKLSGSYKNDLWTEDYLDWNLDQLFDWAVHAVFIPGPNYELLNLTSSKVNSWTNTTVASASAFDKQNNNLLQKTVPQYLSDTGKVQNETYLRFLDLVGQSHDVSWTYTKYFTKLNTRLQNTNFENREGISDDTVYHIGKSYGINLLDGDPNQDLWYYRLGQSSTGTVLQNNPTSSIKTLSSKQRTAEVWKRLVNNLPYLLKAKGTAAGVRAIINCYGIPEHILPINEYGSSKQSEQTTRYKDHNFSYCLNFNSQSIATKWASHHQTVGRSTSSAQVPNSVEFRVWPNPLPQSINNVGQSFSQSLWQIDNEVGVILHRSHSTAKKINGQPEGLTEYGHFELVMSQSLIATSAPKSQDGYMRLSTGKAKIFEKDNNKETGRGWWTVLLNRKAGSKRKIYHSSSRFEYELTALRGDYGTIDQTVSCSLRVTSSGRGKGADNGFMSSSINNSWSGSSGLRTAYLGGYNTSSNPSSYNESMHGSFGDTFNGSFQELRYYANPLSSSTLINHSLAPEMYSSNIGTESYNELLLRLKLTEDKNHWSGSAGLNSQSASNIIPSAHPNLASGKHWDSAKLFIVSGTAYNFPNKRMYGFVEQYSYIDTPELGPNNYTSNKIRVEENKLLRHLSSTARAEKPSSDKYALDSNNLGIYFSPTDQINTDIFNHIGGQLLDNFIGNPQEAYSDRYNGLGIVNNDYWKKYSGDNSKATYLNELKQYDMSLFTMIKRYLPARANATVGVIIEPHFLERSKARSRGRITVTGDTKQQNVAVNAKSFANVKQATSIRQASPQVIQTGFALEPQVITAKVTPVTPTPTSNAVLREVSAAPQQTSVNTKEGPASTVIPAIVQSNDARPLFKLSNENKNSVAKGTPSIVQYNASNVPSHINNQSGNGVNGTIIATKQSQGSTYSFKSLFKSGSGTAQKYIPVSTPSFKASASMDHICDYRYSETRMTNVYHYYSASIEYKAGNVTHGNARLSHAITSASLGKPYEDGSSVNLFAYSKSLKSAQVSDYNLTNRRYQGSQLTATDFNVNSQDGSGEPVVSFIIGDPNTLISSDAGFGGNLRIE